MTTQQIAHSATIAVGPQLAKRGASGRRKWFLLCDGRGAWATE